MKAMKFNADEEGLSTPTQSFDSLKNRKKVDLLKGIDLTKYDEKMIRLLLDGDYKGELKQYKNKIMMLVHEIIDKKIPHTKFGVNTLLYKMVRDAKNDRHAIANIKERQPRVKKAPIVMTEQEDSEEEEEDESEYESTASEEEEEEDEMEEVDEETFIREILKLAKVNKSQAMNVLKLNLSPSDALYKKIVAKIKNF